jgi:hypothetical protein
LDPIYKVLEIQDKTRGPLSSEAGDVCFTIATAHFHDGRYSQAATYYKRAAEAANFNRGCDAEDAATCRKGVRWAVAAMLYWSACRRCCCCCCCGGGGGGGGSGGGGGGGARSRAGYLEEIEEHDTWLEKDARQRGENITAWRRKLLWKRRLYWFFASCVVLFFGNSAVLLANLIRRRTHGKFWFEVPTSAILPSMLAVIAAAILATVLVSIASGDRYQRKSRR